MKQCYGTVRGTGYVLFMLWWAELQAYGMYSPCECVCHWHISVTAKNQGLKTAMQIHVYQGNFYNLINVGFQIEGLVLKLLRSLLNLDTRCERPKVKRRTTRSH